MVLAELLTSCCLRKGGAKRGAAWTPAAAWEPCSGRAPRAHSMTEWRRVTGVGS